MWGAPCTRNRRSFEVFKQPLNVAFYSLCFPCFSPVLFSFCIKFPTSPRAARRLVCLYFLNTTQNRSWFLWHKDEKMLCTIHIIFFFSTHSMFMFPSRMPQLLSECLTVQQVVHVWVVRMIFAFVSGSICMVTSDMPELLISSLSPALAPALDLSALFCAFPE